MPITDIYRPICKETLTVRVPLSTQPPSSCLLLLGRILCEPLLSYESVGLFCAQKTVKFRLGTARGGPLQSLVL